MDIPFRPAADLPEPHPATLSAARCAAASAQDPTPCEGPHTAATIISGDGTEVAGCLHHCARLLAGLDGGRVHPFVPVDHSLEIYSRAGELPPFAWEIGR
ncbi:hypothetical protein [Streptomyces sp. NPDC048644]|uniref:hypothetical protein n=1 Tax=Streptomyces sp. NPDC048644 TaxID=3365582 RepID=UPI0037224079